MRNFHRITDTSVEEFKKLCEKEGIHYDTDEQYRDAAQNMYNLVDVLLEMSLEENARRQRLEKEPKGFSMPGEGRNCLLCGQIVYETDGWYDKWGFKCMNCQKAVDKKIIPGSLCRDSGHEKYMTDSRLSHESGLHIQTVRKLIRHGKIKARQIPDGPYLILKKDNPNLRDALYGR